MMVIELVEGDESRVKWNYGDGWHYADIDDLIRAYESVRHGHWINHFDDLFPEDSSVECSVCHEYEGIMANDNYCPFCGAKMDEVIDGS